MDTFFQIFKKKLHRTRQLAFLTETTQRPIEVDEEQPPDLTRPDLELSFPAELVEVHGVLVRHVLRLLSSSYSKYTEHGGTFSCIGCARLFVDMEGFGASIRQSENDVFCL